MMYLLFRIYYLEEGKCAKKSWMPKDKTRQDRLTTWSYKGRVKSVSPSSASNYGPAKIPITAPAGFKAAAGNLEINYYYCHHF